MDMDRQPIHINRLGRTANSQINAHNHSFLKAEMAPLTKDARGDLEEGGVIVSEESNTTDKATQAENRRNEWLNSRTRGLWWVWLCLYAVSGLVAICSDYSEEEGQLPSAAKWIQRIATVLMVGSYGGIFGILILDQMGGWWTWTDNQSKSIDWVKNSELTGPSQSLVEPLLAEMAPLTTDSRDGIEGGINSSEKCNAANENEWYNSKTRATWWVWICLLAVCALVACICNAYSDENGTLPTATMQIEQIAVLLMFVSSVCMFGILILDQLNLSSHVKWMKPYS
jgi:hypothetical protein